VSDADAIKADIELTRAELARTVDALRQKVEEGAPAEAAAPAEAETPAES